MAQIFRIVGRLAGKAVKTHMFDRVFASAAGYVLSEMRLADIRLKRKFLIQKRDRHFTLLGRTVYRLIINEVNPESDERVSAISRVLGEIDSEIEMVDSELKRRKEYERQKRKTDHKRKSQH